MLELVLLILAAIFFALAALGVGWRNVNFIALGLLSWAIVLIMDRA